VLVDRQSSVTNQKRRDERADELQSFSMREEAEEGEGRGNWKLIEIIEIKRLKKEDQGVLLSTQSFVTTVTVAHDFSANFVKDG
jgi:hypothetical protein